MDCLRERRFAAICRKLALVLRTLARNRPAMLTLYHCRNARSFRALWALEEMGLPYKLHTLPFPPRHRHEGMH